MAKRQSRRQSEGLREYAVVGAEHRLLEIAEEAARIFAVFPELRDPGRGFMALGGSDSGRGRKGAGTGGRKKRTMSAAARKRISQAQKARWARQRAGK
jgi:hypothetical protein